MIHPFSLKPERKASINPNMGIPSHHQMSLKNETVYGNFSYDVPGWATSSNQRVDIEIDVFDLDGVESVWFTYRRSDETNTPSGAMEERGDHPYAGQFGVTVSTFETLFVVRFYANDTLGEVTSSSEYTVLVLYNVPHDDGASNPRWLVLPVVLIVSVAVIIAVRLQGKRSPASRAPRAVCPGGRGCWGGDVSIRPRKLVPHDNAMCGKV